MLRSTCTLCTLIKLKNSIEEKILSEMVYRWTCSSWKVTYYRKIFRHRVSKQIGSWKNAGNCTKTLKLQYFNSISNIVIFYYLILTNLSYLYKKVYWTKKTTEITIKLLSNIICNSNYEITFSSNLKFQSSVKLLQIIHKLMKKMETQLSKVLQSGRFLSRAKSWITINEKFAW